MKWWVEHKRPTTFSAMTLHCYIFLCIMSVIQPAENGNWITNSNPCTTMSQADTIHSTKPVPFNLSEKDIIRFYSKFEKGDPEKCWLWNGTKFSNGYGAFKAGGRTLKASRVSLFLHQGHLDHSLLCLHSCDTVGCVNPNHLSQGDHGKNMDEMKERGRAASGDRHGSKLHPNSILRGDMNPARKHPERMSHGEDHHMVKLSDAQVSEIREKYSQGGIRQVDLAMEYGTIQARISDIVRRKTRKYT